MILVDANLLLYAYNTTAVQHEASRRWLENVLSGSDPVGLAWASLWAFIRISTTPRVFQRPLSTGEAHDAVSEWLRRPNVAVAEPGERHLEILRRLMDDGQASGALVTDAALAAIAIEHGATLFSTDRDFSRFAELDWNNPIGT